MDKVAIIGAGLIGRAWAMVFARAGWEVALSDPVEGACEACLSACREGLNTLAAHGLCEDPDGALKRIVIAGSLTAAVEGARLVQENGPEQLAVKRDVFGALDAAASAKTILASSTSAIQCSLFTEDLPGRHRCLVAHPVNPPHLVPVVELSGAAWTAPEAIAAARAIYKAVGQAPVTVLREIDGFILNRLQVAVLTEAFRLVAEGYVTPEDLDTTISDGLGLRWSFMGPFRTIELNAPEGISDYCRRYVDFFRRCSAELAGPEAWTDEAIAKVIAATGRPLDSGERTRLTAWRDARLAGLAAHKARCQDEEGGDPWPPR